MPAVRIPNLCSDELDVNSAAAVNSVVRLLPTAYNHRNND